MFNKTLIVGVGHAGIRMISALAERFEKSPNLIFLAVDADARTLNAVTNPAIKKIEAGFQYTDGLGCGGNPLKGERCAILARNEVAAYASEVRGVIWVGGLGGGMASGGITTLRRAWCKTKVPQLVVVTLPFSFEGDQRKQNAENALREFQNSGGNVLLKIKNDLLFAALPHDTSASAAFEAADRAMGNALYGLSQLFAATPLLADGYASLQNLLTDRTADASIGVMTTMAGASAERLQDGMLKLAQSPLLGGPQFLKDAHAAVCLLTGATDLSIGEMKKALSDIKTMFGKSTADVTAVSIDPLLKETLQLTVIAIHYDQSGKQSQKQEHTVLEVTHQRMRRDDRMRRLGEPENPLDQPDLPIQEYSRGIFTGLSTTPVDGTDLDIPTFQRVNLQIDQGL